jgi:hypothetical protein
MDVLTSWSLPLFGVEFFFLWGLQVKHEVGTTPDLFGIVKLYHRCAHFQHFLEARVCSRVWSGSRDITGFEF